MESHYYEFSVGKIRGFVLYDQAQAHSAEDLIVNPDRGELIELSEAQGFDVSSIPVGFNNLLLETAGQYVLVDAGFQRPIGEVRVGLGQLGIDPGEVRTIVITHSDMDHVGGILDENGEIVYPNAEYVILEESWQYWLTEDSRSELTRMNNWTEEKMKFVWGVYSQIQDRIATVESGGEVLPGFQLFPAPGHRCDHSYLEITDSGNHLIHLADAIVHPLFITKLHWVSTYDADPSQALDTKKVLLELCAGKNALVFASHFPFPGLGFIHRNTEGWSWVSV